MLRTVGFGRVSLVMILIDDWEWLAKRRLLILTCVRVLHLVVYCIYLDGAG
jgi:hypothetical protein